MNRQRHFLFIAVYAFVALIGLASTAQDNVTEREESYIVEGRDSGVANIAELQKTPTAITR